MTPVSPESLHPPAARTGLGWLLQSLLASRPAASDSELLFPAADRHPASETFIASLIIGAWSLAAATLLCLHSPLLPASILLRLLVALAVWLATLHLAVLLPLCAAPLLRLFHLPAGRLAGLVECAFLLLLTLAAWCLASFPSPFARTLGLAWIVLIMAEVALRLARAAIALASRPR